MSQCGQKGFFMEDLSEMLSLYSLAFIFILFIIYTGHMLLLWTVKELSFKDSLLRSSEFIIGVVATSVLFIVLGVWGMILVFAIYFIYYWGGKKMENRDAAYQAMLISLLASLLAVLIIPFFAGSIMGFIGY